ncbi:hypothetical protein DCAR_0206655 [Daucus carota subsp. sativus]|uniref:RING-CH-type domain-containing protein n=1 Tax=Daucus carota subsp. sativus TaxID=79200 RepID=A0A166DCB6_DAUCS|nr:PREDICTED: uncharacterized protein LOC108207012 [Daucus carota subsp. sativus]WOG87430.1 hypothetical protein DCAR_0206655 [Daucus carota subsp. sativus]
MSSAEVEVAVQIEQRRRHRRWTHTPQITFSSGGTTTDGSVYFSDSEEEENGGECGVSGGDEEEEVDLESGELERKVHSYYRNKRRRRRKKKKRDGEERDEGGRECRICHLDVMERDNGGGEMVEEEGENGGGYIQLGCDCKGDLGAAHKRCAETWFKIRGNIICEICGAIALNVASEQMIEALNVSVEQTNLANYTDGPVTEVNAAPEVVSGSRFFDGRRLMNVLLVCMIVAFIISWLFHFHVFH